MDWRKIRGVGTKTYNNTVRGHITELEMQSVTRVCEVFDGADTVGGNMYIVYGGSIPRLSCRSEAFGVFIHKQG